MEVGRRGSQEKSEVVGKWFSGRGGGFGGGCVKERRGGGGIGGVGLDEKVKGMGE